MKIIDTNEIYKAMQVKKKKYFNIPGEPITVISNIGNDKEFIIDFYIPTITKQSIENINANQNNINEIHNELIQGLFLSNVNSIEINCKDEFVLLNSAAEYLHQEYVSYFLEENSNIKELLNALASGETIYQGDNDILEIAKNELLIK